MTIPMPEGGPPPAQDQGEQVDIQKVLPRLVEKLGEKELQLSIGDILVKQYQEQRQQHLATIEQQRRTIAELTERLET